MLLASLVFSCNKDQGGPKFPSDVDTGVGFRQNRVSVDVKNIVDNSVNLEVTRGYVKTDVTYNVTLTAGEGDMITLPGTISFTKGSYTATLTFKLDGTQMAAGTNYSFTIKVAPEGEWTNMSISNNVIVTAKLAN